MMACREGCAKGHSTGSSFKRTAAARSGATTIPSSDHRKAHEHNSLLGALKKAGRDFGIAPGNQESSCSFSILLLIMSSCTSLFLSSAMPFCGAILCGPECVRKCAPE